MEEQYITQKPLRPANQPNTIFVSIVVLVVLIILDILIFWIYGVYQAKNIKQENITVSVSATAEPSVQATATVSPDDYVIDDSDKREITKSELQGLGEWQLKVARNELYARYGRKFDHQDLQCYFDKKSWYKIDSNFSEADLSELEKSNIATILEYEKEINSSYLDYDSGCSSL
jgi:hypothetical protein